MQECEHEDCGRVTFAAADILLKSGGLWTVIAFAGTFLISDSYHWSDALLLHLTSLAFENLYWSLRSIDRLDSGLS